MKVKDLIKKALVSACVIFTLITAVYMLILQIMNLSSQSVGIEAGRVLLFFVFSLLLAIANAILLLPRLNAIIKYIAHYLLFILGFWTCFCIPNDMNASKTLVGIALATIGYAIVIPIIALFKRIFKKATQPEEKYEKQFSSSSKKRK